MSDRDIESELCALRSRAGAEEARRLAARERGDWPTASAAELELTRLGRRHDELKRQRQRVA